MSTRPCPNCHEIIPSELDYCPYCNESTRETLHTADDIALSQHQERAAATAVTLTPDSVSESAPSGAAPSPAVERCIMCNMAPSTIGDYCLDCRTKLDMGPEQWDLIKQDANRRKMIIVSIAAVILLIAIVVLATRHHPRPAAPSAGAAAQGSTQ